MAKSATEGFWVGKSVLVTGAGGFVGSALAQSLVDRGAAVTAILRDYPARSNFELLGLGSRVNVVRGSITDLSLVERTFTEFDVDSCFHLAAQALVGAANRSPLSTFESNIRGTWQVLEVCRTSPLVRRVVVASSDKAYGEQPVMPYVEDMPLNGAHAYDVSKVCTDLLARSYGSSYGLPVAVSRCANIYGPGDFNMSRLIPGTIQAALRGERPVIRSDGTPVRDYLFIDDAVAAYLALAEHCREEDVAGEAFNFGTDNPVSALDLVRMILGLCSASHLEPDIRGVGKIAGEIHRQFLSSEKAMRRLGWVPRISLEEGIGRTIAWHRRLVGEAANSPLTGAARG